jgi:hypothetical protein
VERSCATGTWNEEPGTGNCGIEGKSEMDPAVDVIQFVPRLLLMKS